jgi:hypothetical protein
VVFDEGQEGKRMTINIPLLTKVLVHIRRNPAQHNQDFWGLETPECGTVHCFAGWTAALTGAELLWRQLEGGKGRGVGSVQVGDRKMSVASYAARVLNLDAREKNSLFYASNFTLWLRTAALTNGEVTMAKIDTIIAEQDVARHRKEDEKKTDEETKDNDRTEPERTGRDNEESDGRDNEEPYAEIRELVHA